MLEFCDSSWSLRSRVNRHRIALANGPVHPSGTSPAVLQSRRKRSCTNGLGVSSTWNTTGCPSRAPSKQCNPCPISHQQQPSAAVFASRDTTSGACSTKQISPWDQGGGGGGVCAWTCVCGGGWERTSKESSSKSKRRTGHFGLWNLEQAVQVILTPTGHPA